MWTGLKFFFFGVLQLEVTQHILQSSFSGIESWEIVREQRNAVVTVLFYFEGLQILCVSIYYNSRGTNTWGTDGTFKKSADSI
jgi:hypothetical protein